jgi:hypothetical protein
LTEPSLPDLAGEPYETVLERLHKILRPKTYLEIGTLNGNSLKLAECAAIAVDPNFQFDSGEFMGRKPYCALFQMTSDEFFAEHDPGVLFRRPVDMAFLDGMHLSEFLLRDFANTERHCRRNSLILLHDCVPTEWPMAERSPGLPPIVPHRAGWWTGDVWRTVVALKRHRSDLEITALDATPTGLICITNLDPHSRTLTEDYVKICGEMQAIDLKSFGLENYFALLELRSTALLQDQPSIAARFWL